MKRQRVDSSLERQFLIGMITSKPFLAGVVPIIDVDLIPTRYVQLVSEWCVKYFREYGDAPGKSIESIFHAWSERKTGPADADTDAIGDFIAAMSAEYDDAAAPINAPHLLDEFTKHQTKHKINRLKETLESSMVYGDVDDALSAIHAFRTIDTAASGAYDPLAGKSVTSKTYAAPRESLFDFPGDAGRFFAGRLTRDSLIGVQSPEKRGKTWWCLEMVYRALRARRRVAFFQVGDSSEEEINERFDMRVTALPMDDHLTRIPYPMKIELVDDGDGGKKPSVTHRYRKFTRTVNAIDANHAHKRFHRRMRITRGKHVRFVNRPMSTINVAGIDGLLQRWKYEEDFVPDVTVIDYADILAPEDPRVEFRHQIGETWRALRRLSQTWHMCVIAPTQASAESYDATTQTMRHFSENKNKYSHVTGMFALNQTPDEKINGIMRLNWLAGRRGVYDSNRCLYVAQCIPLGAALVMSVW